VSDSDTVKCCILMPRHVLGPTHEMQLAEWMIDNDIDANRVMDYIREVEETRMVVCPLTDKEFHELFPGRDYHKFMSKASECS
jgi:hypothetical protein